MTFKVVLDKAGRVVLPKPVRDQMKLEPGDSFDLEAEGERIALRPLRAKAALKKELGVWVYQGEPSDLSIPDFLDKLRDERDLELQK